MSAGTQAINVAVIDEQCLFRQGICNALSGFSKYNIIAEGDSFNSAIDIVEKHKPQVILLDYDLSGGSLNILENIKRKTIETRSIILANSANEDGLTRAFKAGAAGYVSKNVAPSKLDEIIYSVHRGSNYAEPSLATSLLVQTIQNENKEENPFAALTKREADILSCVAEGMTNREIAAYYKIAEKTVKHYMTGIFQKLRVRNRVEAALVAHMHLKHQETIRSNVDAVQINLNRARA